MNGKMAGKLFREIWGDTLIKHGFFFKDKAFYRLDFQGKRMHAISHPFRCVTFAVAFSVVPFSLPIEQEGFKDCCTQPIFNLMASDAKQKGDDSLSQYIHIPYYDGGIEKAMPYEFQFFMENIFEHFIAVDSAQSSNDCRAWLVEQYNGAAMPDQHVELLDSLMVGNYKRAEYLVNGYYHGAQNQLAKDHVQKTVWMCDFYTRMKEEMAGYLEGIREQNPEKIGRQLEAQETFTMQSMFGFFGERRMKQELKMARL